MKRDCSPEATSKQKLAPLESSSMEISSSFRKAAAAGKREFINSYIRFFNISASGTRLVIFTRGEKAAGRYFPAIRRAASSSAGAYVLSVISENSAVISRLETEIPVSIAFCRPPSARISFKYSSVLFVSIL